jgi:hypothetical protein
MADDPHAPSKSAAAKARMHTAQRPPPAAKSAA